MGLAGVLTRRILRRERLEFRGSGAFVANSESEEEIALGQG
jgi:hypothetical protein